MNLNHYYWYIEILNVPVIKISSLKNIEIDGLLKLYVYILNLDLSYEVKSQIM